MADELPEGWTLVPLNTVAERITKGATPTSYGHSFQRTGIRFIKVENIRTGKIDHQSIQDYITPAAHNSQRRSILAAGDLLFSIAGTIGATCIVSPEDIPANTNQALAIIRGTNRVLVPQYLQHALVGLLARRANKENARGVGMNNISLADVGAFEVRIPPFAEQRRIVAKVEALLAEVNVARNRLAKVPEILKRFRQSVLAAACSGGLSEDWRQTHQLVTSPETLVDPQAAGESPDAAEHLEGIEFPESWTCARVDTLVSVQNGRAFPSAQYQEHGIRLLRPGNLHVGGRVEWTQENTAFLPRSWARECPEFVLDEGELVMNLTAQSLRDEFLGRVCLKSDPDPALLNQRIARFIKRSTFDPRPYLLLYFRSRFFRAFVNGLDTGSLIRHMHSKDVARHVVPVPPPEEQKEVVRRVESLFKIADTAELRLGGGEARASTLAQAILSKAFRGELVPTEAELARQEGREYEPASLLLERFARKAKDH
jgi:type I restriction enzyme, S subunit